MAFTKLEQDLNIIQKLDDEPNDVGGLTAAELKAKFDESGNLVKDWINNTFIPEAEEAIQAAQRESVPDHGLNHAHGGKDPVTPAMIGAHPDTWVPTLMQVGGSNPNLLDNRYFADPVNQRGQTEYSGAGYTIDRWKLEDGTLTLSENGMVLNGTLVQIRETPIGQPVVASALTTAGMVEAVYDDETKTFTLTGTGETFVAAKLEPGTEQTLARQDENGNWVLNDPPPNKQQELAKCQRYYYRAAHNSIGRTNFAGTATATNVLDFHNMNFPTTMRAVPVVQKLVVREDATGTVKTLSATHYPSSECIRTAYNITPALTNGYNYTVTELEVSADL